MRSALPETLMDMAERSAAPATVLLALRRALEERPDLADRLVDGDAPSGLGRAFVAVVAASNALGRLGAADPRAFDVLDDLDHPVVIDATDALALARSKRLELLRIAARDLLAIDTLDEVGRGLADMADRVLQGAWSLAAGEIGGADLAVIGMGKLGGRELNYASDVDVMFVTDGRGIEGAGDKLARRLLAIARGCFRVDVDLRPEGRSGPLTRSLDGYRSYWNKGALAWEFQALMKARPVAGDVDIGAGFAGAAEQATWSRTFSADELAQLRMMKARAEADALRPGLAGREIKRAPGGIRDVEFSVQLLQLVHGHHDPDIRDRSTLGALTELALAGYVSPEDGRVLADSYRFLRTVEHRLQLVEEEQTHALPTDAAARDRLARVLGFTDGPASTATASFDETLRRCQSEVRIIHERLFFRPLLEAFAVLEPSPPVEGTGDAPVRVMSADAVSRRLTAFGFSDARRTRAAVEELARGLSRVSRLMGQLLPLLLDWLSISPDPDLGLLGLRSLVVRSHHRALVVTTFRESLEAARRLCLILGSSRAMAEAVEHNPELIATLDDDRALAPESRAELVEGALERLHRPGDEGRRRARLVRLTQDQTLRIATRDLLDIDDIASTGAALTDVAEAVLEASLDHVAPDVSFCVVGMGRLGGAEMSYASDLDVLFVFDDGS
ncbi:MAG TPA: hypothetical protein VID75_03705, partial [Acidimicrobiales bacterium]